jgi:hypothetical protein
MVVNFRCSAETKELLDRVVASGRYGIKMPYAKQWWPILPEPALNSW